MSAVDASLAAAEQASGVAPQAIPAARLAALCDPGSLHLIRSDVTSESLGERAQPGDGVLAGAGTVAGRPVFCFAEDGRFLGGALGEAHAATICRVLELAGRARAPVVGFVESAGARMQEGSAALAGYGRVFRASVALSGRVPQISIICGTSAGGGSYSSALTDFVIVTAHAAMFLTGPAVVRQATGEQVSAEALGGPRVHERNGVCHLVAADEGEAARLARRLLGYLPSNASGSAPECAPSAPASGDPGSVIPARHSRVYDVRSVLDAVVDAADFLELAPRWARNVVTGFARLDGRAIGVVANQPRHLGGIIDAAASQKAARFVRTCNLYGIPLVVFVDTPGFMPGARQESAGIIRHGAKLLHAFAEAEVAKLSIVLRQAYGGGFIAMNSKGLGADLAFAWPEARIGIMAARQAVGVVNRREIERSPFPEQARERLAADYEQQHLTALAAARMGVIDEVLDPSATRSRIAAALTTLAAKRKTRACSGNIPL